MPVARPGTDRPPRVPSADPRPGRAVLAAARLALAVAAGLAALGVSGAAAAQQPPSGAGATSEPGDERGDARPTATARDTERAGEAAALLELALDEYREAVEGDEVVNADEYAEARAMTGRAAGLFDDLRRGTAGPSAEETAARLDSLSALVEDRGPPSRYAELAERTVEGLRQGWNAVVVPERTRRPSLGRGEELYRAACAACHGAEGRGGGRAAEGLDPPPPDLTADERRREASAARDYLVIMHGIPGTAMPAARDWLSPAEAWDLVAYLRSLAGPAEAPGPDD